jgi:hypothetical protein
MASPRKSVEMLAISCWAARLSRSTTSASRSRLPSIRLAISGAAAGANRLMKTVTAIGKISTAARETGRGAYSMRTRRSLEVVSRRISGGWMIGTRLM